ncbi:uncharacterized protein LOC135201971 [Macrobrachium nipponense]|uniref:uncharacterized protein LOC135201971 n=1 Tax=Macrobrachium nipponense TaxID=159736 RepID=UPI0030C8102D
MGCHYSKENQCYSSTCCFCMSGKAACYWIGIVSLVWETFTQCFDYLTAYSEYEYCPTCIEDYTNTRLGFGSGIISSGQWVMSILLMIGAKMELRFLVLLWLAWTCVTLAMLSVWFFYSMPFMPNVRGLATIIKLFWVVHYFIVVKTHYSKLSVPGRGLNLKVPPSSPIRRSHKRRKIRDDPNHQPVIRTLLAVAVKLKTYKECKSISTKDEPSGTSDDLKIPTGGKDEEGGSRAVRGEETAVLPSGAPEDLEVGSSQQVNSTSVNQPTSSENFIPQGELSGTKAINDNITNDEDNRISKSGISNGADNNDIRPPSHVPNEKVPKTTTSLPQILHMEKKRVRRTTTDDEEQDPGHRPSDNNQLEETTAGMRDSTTIIFPDACVPGGRRRLESDVSSKSARQQPSAIKRRKSYRVAVGHDDDEHTAADDDEESRVLHVTDL